MRLFILLFFLVVRSAVAQDCALKLDKDSIKVYTCTVQHTKVKAVKASFIVHGTMSQLAIMVMDIDNYYQWQYKTESARILKKVNNLEMIYHTVVESPVVTSNRDFVIHLTLKQDPVTKVLIIEAVSVPDYIPRVKNVVRVPFSKARWTIKPLGPSKLSVEYEIEIDIGGAVPAWVINLVAPEAPYQTFKELKNKIAQYKGQKVIGIRD